jgi:hypothetical protein
MSSTQAASKEAPQSQRIWTGIAVFCAPQNTRFSCRNLAKFPGPKGHHRLYISRQIPMIFIEQNPLPDHELVRHAIVALGKNTLFLPPLLAAIMRGRPPSLYDTLTLLAAHLPRYAGVIGTMFARVGFEKNARKHHTQSTLLAESGAEAQRIKPRQSKPEIKNIFRFAS